VERLAHDGPHAEGDWERAPRLIEDEYRLIDAVVAGNLLISLLRHADRVRIACQGQLVDAIGAIRSEPGGPSWRPCWR
jgi:alpha-L-arabinofuranosidase